MEGNKSRPKVQRTALRSSRQLDYCTVKNLSAQVGHGPDEWPIVILKELLDNALDACDESEVAPEIRVTIDEHGITVCDNGPGIPPEVVEGIIDFDDRVSTRAAYVSCDRGAQGQAWKTLLLMHYVLSQAESYVEIVSQGLRHGIVIRVDQIQRKVVVQDMVEETPTATEGTSVLIGWPNSPDDEGFLAGRADAEDSDLEESRVLDRNSPSSILRAAKSRFLQVAQEVVILNPHLTLTVDWHGDQVHYTALNTGWQKWRPCDPTSPHWYTAERFQQLVAAYISHDQNNGHPRTVRELIEEFDGLTSTGKQKIVLDATGLSRTPLAGLAHDGRLDSETIATLLAAMQQHSRRIKPAKLGLIGRENIAARFAELGCDMDTLRYRRATGHLDDVPFLLEVAFALNEDLDERRLITGIHWSPTVGNPFRELGENDEALDAILEDLEAGADEPIVLLIHLVHPGVGFSNQGKSAVLLGKWEEP